MRKWLNRCEVPSTFCSYRLEVARLAIWFDLSENRSLNRLSDDDWAVFVEFLKDPPVNLIGHVKASYASSEWKPFFRTGLKTAALRTSLRIFSSLYQELQAEGLVARNLALINIKNQKWERLKEPKVPALTDDDLSCVEAHLKTLPTDDDGPRLRWIFSLLRSGFRVSELEDPRNTMAAFRDVLLGRSTTVLAYSTCLGVREIPTLGSELASRLQDYRLSMDLWDLPHPDEDAPLVSSEAGNVITRQALHKLMKSVFCFVADECAQAGAPAAMVERLRCASLESVRLGAAREIAEQRGAIDARAFLGLKSLTNVPSLDQRLFENYRAKE
ncbi:tyrosine-type recombinase/integrase [Cupriavidus sp. P-10]|uniref:hypothetical protein n=1 Tax=Cupriavidus sp. P-10 TaxID=2027911 RepID=UPI0011C15891|nr:hypothetical protein [Cupriavidus sp. P-10]BDB27229.1 tyrosine-type recombinase/integrase [Cupriavidus sp. P-10]